MLSLRPYQRESVEAVYKALRETDDNPCVEIPTAGGKSCCIAQVAADAVKNWNGRVMILAHVRELLEQNADKIAKLCPGIPVGVYSAGLGRRDTEQPIVVGGIQSVYDKAELFGGDVAALPQIRLLRGGIIDGGRGGRAAAQQDDGGDSCENKCFLHLFFPSVTYYISITCHKSD